MSNVQEALEERGVRDAASADEKMGHLLAYHLGDASWWDEVKAWMTEVGYTPLGVEVLTLGPDDRLVVHVPLDMEVNDETMDELREALGEGVLVTQTDVRLTVLRKETP
ncbi:MAG: hypothetical protein V3T24_02955 [Longimicrobiales bacterium]